MSVGQKVSTTNDPQQATVSHASPISATKEDENSESRFQQQQQYASGSLLTEIKPQQCNKIFFGQDTSRVICKCDESHCDNLSFDWPTDSSHILRVESSKSGSRFKQTLLDLREHSLKEPSLLNVDESEVLIDLQVNKYKQQVLGFGASLSDSSASLLNKLSKSLRKRLLADYFSKEVGSNYNLVRTTIGGSDFSSRPYSLDDTIDGSEDFELKNFALAPEDMEDKIPLLKEISASRSVDENNFGTDKDDNDVKIFAASWSPPAWMKANNNLVRGRFKSGKKYMDAYARYIIKFLKEYESHGISIFSLSSSNEPLTPILLPDNIKFNSLEMSPSEMAMFVGNSLIPELIKNNYTAEKINLLLWDDNILGFDKYQAELMAVPLIREYTKAIGIHWYMHGWRQKMSYKDLHELKHIIPGNIWTISSEASFIGGPSAGNWTRGSKYAKDIIENLNAGNVAWIDWNMALNMSGGPTWVNNVLDSAIIVNPSEQVYYKNPMYYTIAHISRFLPPKSNVVPTKLWTRSNTLDNIRDINVVAAELTTTTIINHNNTNIYDPISQSPGFLRRFSIVIQNHGIKDRSVKLFAPNCKSSQQNDGSLLVFKLEAESISSLAINC